MGCTDDGLRVIDLAVVNQQIGPGAVESVLAEELILAKPVVLVDRGQHSSARDVPQPHAGT